MKNKCAYYIYPNIRPFDYSIQTLLIYSGLLGWGIAEAFYGNLQLYGFYTSNNMLYRITGSFENPGPYAGFLAAILPLAVYAALQSSGKNTLSGKALSVLAWINIFLTATILPATMSRAAWLAASVGTGIILIVHYKIIARLHRYIVLHRKQAGIYAVVVCSLLILIGAGIYHLKKDSADGRLLMWKVTTRIIAQHPLTGVGHGNFAGAYGQAQAAYFANGNASPQEEYVAGSPEYAFNEFLQIAAEYGPGGLFLFVAIVIWAFRNAHISRQTGITGSLAALLIFACFSYPLRVGQSEILFIILLVTAIVGPKKKAVLLVSALLLLPYVWNWENRQEKQKAVEQWKDEQSYYNMGIYEETADNYRKLYPQLQDEPKFLFELGHCLAKTGQYEESNRFLLEGGYKSSDPMFWNIMGKNYQALGRYHEAETCFTHAWHIVPNRLYPLYLLANLYFESNQSETGIAMARKVINKEPKVVSQATNEMKTEMKEKLNQYNQPTQ